jgi:predicted metal-dependent phosphoesterase TrpH
MAFHIDLHLHTHCSDGEFSPGEVIQRAVDLGLKAIAIADHDTLAGVLPALGAAHRVSLDCIPGVEISCELAEGEAHLLGYCVCTDDETALSSKLAQFRASRVERAHRMVERLARLGMPLEWSEVAALANGESVGRPHVAQAMVRRGHVSTVAEAFDRYLRRDGPAYVPRFKVAPEEAIRLIHEARGVAVLAHPAGILDVVGWLANEGLDGLEAYYPLYSPEVSDQLAAVARRYDMIVTGGSDYHGPTVSPGAEIGSVDVPEEVVAALYERQQALNHV